MTEHTQRIDQERSLLRPENKGSPGFPKLHIHSGLHKGLIADIEHDTFTVGADQDSDLVLLDITDVELVFEREGEAHQSWFVHSTGGELRLGGIEVSNYERHPISHLEMLSCNEIEMQLMYPQIAAKAQPVAVKTDPRIVAAVATLGKEISVKQHGHRLHALAAGVIFAGALGAGVSSWLHFNSYPVTGNEKPSPVALAISSIPPPADQGASREQIADFINAQRLPVTVQSISANAVNLVWSGADAIPTRTQRLIGDELFGREVKWVQASTAVATDEPHLSPAKRALRAAIDRGNQKTEETLRNLGLADIAQVQANHMRGSSGRFILTRSGHRVFEGSDLRSGAQLKSIGAEEMTVASNGTVMIVPYDVAKPVKKVTSALTVVNSGVVANRSTAMKSINNTPDQCDLTKSEGAGTVVAICKLRMNQVSKKANEISQIAAVNPVVSSGKNGSPQTVSH